MGDGLNLAALDPRPQIAFKKFELLAGSIRNIVGFERFLLGPAKSEVTMLAESGPIVVFNVSEVGSDAIIATKGSLSFMHPAKTPSQTTKRFLDVVSGNSKTMRPISASLKLY